MTHDQTRIIYILYFIGAFIWPVLLVGVILAYIEKRRDFDLTLYSHLRKQIRIFWTHLFIAFAGLIFVIFIFLILLMMSTPDNLWDYNASTYQTYTIGSFAVVMIYGIVLLAYVWIASLNGLRRLDANAPID